MLDVAPKKIHSMTPRKIIQEKLKYALRIQSPEAAFSKVAGNLRKATRPISKSQN